MIGSLQHDAPPWRTRKPLVPRRVLRRFRVIFLGFVANLLLVAAAPPGSSGWLSAGSSRTPTAQRDAESTPVSPPRRSTSSKQLAAAAPRESVRRTHDDLPAASAGSGAASARALPAGWTRTRTHHLEIQYDPDHQGGVKRLKERGDALLESTAERLGLQPSRRYVVRLVKDRGTFERVQPGRPPPWAAGTAYPRYGLMVILTGEGALWHLPNGFERVFVHECSHLLLGEVARDRPFPRWFDEGLARLMAGEFSMEEWTLLSRGVLFGKLIWFSQLDRGFPIAEGRANLAYAQSRSFLSYLTSQFGPDVLPALVKEISRGYSLNDALWHVVGRGLNSLEEAWRADLGRDMKWMSALFGGATLWGMMGLLVILAYLKRKAQSRRRRARWAEEEAGWYDETPAPLEARLQFQWIAGSPRRQALEGLTHEQQSRRTPGLPVRGALEGEDVNRPASRAGATSDYPGDSNASPGDTRWHPVVGDSTTKAGNSGER